MSAIEFSEETMPRIEPMPAVGGTQPSEQIAQIDRSVRRFVAERPVVAVLCALGVGYVVGRILSRVS